MKNIYILLLALTFSTVTKAAKGLTATFDYEVFMTGTQPYVETYLWVDGSSLNYLKIEDQKQASLDVTIIFSNASGVVFYDKYALLSKSYTLKDSLYENLMEVRKIALDPGKYTYELILTDPNQPNGKAIEHKDSLEILPMGNAIKFSRIQLIEAYQPTKEENMFSRGGYDILPYFDNMYDDNQQRLKFYVEVYNTDKQLGTPAKYLLTYYIETFENTRQLENFTKRKREETTMLKRMLAEVDISELPAGNYNLVVEIRDSLNQYVASTSKYFKRYNESYAMKLEDFSVLPVENTFISAFSHPDTLKEFIRSVRPISNNTEVTYAKNVVANGDPVLMQRYLLSFWMKRNANEPGREFYQYKSLVAGVNKAFGTLTQRGYETDRGRVYLQYGPPNSVNARYNEPSALPYEIWQYYQIKAQSNVRFVFYNPDQVSNDFVLLHSDCRGEINNRQWEMFIHNRNNSFNVDQNNVIKHYGSWSDVLFNQPR